MPICESLPFRSWGFGGPLGSVEHLLTLRNVSWRFVAVRRCSRCVALGVALAESTTLTELIAVGPDSTRLAIATPPDRLDIIDIVTHEVVLSTGVTNAVFPKQWPDRMVAGVAPREGVLGLLDFVGRVRRTRRSTKVCAR
jgi:hypothetical protein